MKQKTGAQLIAAERARQIRVERWTPEHDDLHTYEDLAQAAATYALPLRIRGNTLPHEVPAIWPWDYTWYNPTPDDRVRELVKAGALIAAEIDRLHRKKK